MKLSAGGLASICGSEALRLSAYLDTGDVPTIGWGHTRGVKLGDTCTEEQALVWRREDCAIAEGEVNRLCGGMPLTQGMYDCLVSFEFNTGGLVLEGGAPSKVLLALQERRWADAGEEMLKWNIDNGRTLQGLFRRRLEELRMYASEKWPAS